MQEAQSKLKENIHENLQENIKELKEKRNYMRYARRMAGGMCSLIGTLLAIYVGGWLMLLSPLKETAVAFFLGTITRRMVIVTTLKCAFSLPTVGAIWCGGYILNRRIVGYEKC